MPTFRTIGMDPELTNRGLWTHQRTRRRRLPSMSLGANAAGNEGTIVNHHHTEDAENHLPIQDYLPIESPLALLVRGSTSNHQKTDYRGGVSAAATSSSSSSSCLYIPSNLDDATDLLKGNQTPTRIMIPIDMDDAERLRSDVAIAMIKYGTPFQNDSARQSGPQTYHGFSSMKSIISNRSLAASQEEWVGTSLSTGCSSLDGILCIPSLGKENAGFTYDRGLRKETDHGITRGYITQFTGPTGSGRTLLMLQLAIRAVIESSLASSLREDSAFCVFLTSKLPQSMPWRTALSRYDDDVTTTSLKNLTVCYVENAFGVLQALSGSVTSKTQLIIIDSVSGCLDQHSSSGQDGDSSYMDMVAYELRKLSRVQGKAVVVTNGVVRRGPNDIYSKHPSLKPAMGKAWESLPDINVWMEKTSVYSGGNDPSCSDVVECQLLKHPVSPVTGRDSCCNVRLTKGGLH